MKINRQPIRLRIHGDNIIECERGLRLIAASFSATVHHLVSSPYMPLYEIVKDATILFQVELLSGHGRWGINIQDVFLSQGAPVREAADAIVTKISREEETEEVMLAIEFSSALPAGNNAWQRNGRALACAVVGIPYLYFTEVGGIELGKNREIINPRFPNPIVPFSYLTASQMFNELCLPVYAASPSSSKEIHAQFSHIAGIEDAKIIVRHILESNLSPASYKTLSQKAMLMVTTLAGARKRADTLRGDNWSVFLNLETDHQKTEWLQQRQKEWKKKRASKVKITDTFKKLIEQFDLVKSVPVGASGIPICLVPQEERHVFATQISDLYDDSIDKNFIAWLDSGSPLIIVWITGFKPRGDDSRPDRGLVPLARMLFGNSIEILTIVSGPAKPKMWSLLEENAQLLSQQNGLWASVINLSNGILVDSRTLPEIPLTLLLHPSKTRNQQAIQLPIALPTTKFSEHDVDTIIHLLFSSDFSKGIFESMCNPPGGDWSGLSAINFDTATEVRWTSLPRVSKVGGKRPDHVVQFNINEKNSMFFAIESKDVPSKIAKNLGPRLITYVEELFAHAPTAIKEKESDWHLYKKGGIAPIDNPRIISGGAFLWTKESSLVACIEKCQFDVVIALEFDSTNQSVLLHLMAKPAAQFLLPEINRLAQCFGGRLEIQIH